MMRQDMLNLADAWDLVARSHELRRRWRKRRSRLDRLSRERRSAQLMAETLLERL
jgi:hypothetical protein